MACTLCKPLCWLAACLPGATIISTGGICKALLWFMISFNGHCKGSSSGLRSQGSGVDIWNRLLGGVGAVYKSSEDNKCLFKYHFAMVIFSVPSMSDSESELLLSLLSQGELYCAPVSLTCSHCGISVWVC